MGRDHITHRISIFWLSFILAVVPHQAQEKDSAQSPPLALPCPVLPWAAGNSSRSLCAPACTEGQPLQRAALLPHGVNGKLIPDSHLSHADLINSNSFGFVGWRVPGFRSALPESKPGQLCLLILEMHSKEKQHPCAVTQERWLNLPASSSAALSSPCNPCFQITKQAKEKLRGTWNAESQQEALQTTAAHVKTFVISDFGGAQTLWDFTAKCSYLRARRLPFDGLGIWISGHLQSSGVAMGVRTSSSYSHWAVMVLHCAPPFRIFEEFCRY